MSSGVPLTSSGCNKPLRWSWMNDREERIKEDARESCGWTRGVTSELRVSGAPYHLLAYGQIHVRTRRISGSV